MATAYNRYLSIYEIKIRELRGSRYVGKKIESIRKNDTKNCSSTCSPIFKIFENMSYGAPGSMITTIYRAQTRREQGEQVENKLFFPSSPGIIYLCFSSAPCSPDFYFLLLLFLFCSIKRRY